MRHRSSCTTFAATVLLSVSACAQSTFQVSYAANLDAGDSVVNIVNTGASSGDICINVYTFQPDEQIGPAEMVRLQSNGLLSCSVRDLMSNPLTPVVGTSVVIKLVSTKLCVTPTGGTGCDPSCPILGNLIGGMAAWVTTIHAAPATPGTPAITYGVTETPFTPATLSDSEIVRLDYLRNFILAQGSGSGMSHVCRSGGR